MKENCHEIHEIRLSVQIDYYKSMNKIKDNHLQ